MFCRPNQILGIFNNAARTKNNTAKTEYIVQKEAVTDTFTLTATNQSPTKCDIEKYMELFNKSFNMKCQIEHLKKMS